MSAKTNDLYGFTLTSDTLIILLIMIFLMYRYLSYYCPSSMRIYPVMNVNVPVNVV